MDELVSIIVPVYNVDKYLKDALLSIDNQTYKNIEVILVDDGSTDNSPKLLDNYAASHSNIKVIHKENGGVSTARNIGLKNSKGKYISFLDPDDIIHPDFIKILVEEIENNNSDFVCCSIKNFKENKTISDFAFDIKKNYRIENYTGEVNVFNTFMVEYKMNYHVVNKIYKREILESLSIFPNIFPLDCHYSDDTHTNKRVLMNCSKGTKVNAKLYFLRIRKNSITHSSFKTSMLTVEKCYELDKNLDQIKYKSSIPYLKSYICFHDMLILIRISKSNYNNIEEIKRIYKRYLSTIKYCFKGKINPWYRKYFMWVTIPIIWFDVYKQIIKIKIKKL